NASISAWRLPRGSKTPQLAAGSLAYTVNYEEMPFPDAGFLGRQRFRKQILLDINNLIGK
ncbi:hypothetical protein, partial [Muricomes intestini]|uniref:hypothetical protein n=1 Tax=Muricomes intestini TaxID=1796634 RepID=UPI002FE063EC